QKLVKIRGGHKKRNVFAYAELGARHRLDRRQPSQHVLERIAVQRSGKTDKGLGVLFRRVRSFVELAREHYVDIAQPGRHRRGNRADLDFGYAMSGDLRQQLVEAAQVGGENGHVQVVETQARDGLSQVCRQANV